MKNITEILSLFHHLHHVGGRHEVHHCGGKHASVDRKLNYEIRHCKCGQHAINKKTAIGHATGKNLQPLKLKIKFLESCPDGGWHVESGIKINDELKN